MWNSWCTQRHWRKAHWYTLCSNSAVEEVLTVTVSCFNRLWKLTAQLSIPVPNIPGERVLFLLFLFLRRVWWARSVVHTSASTPPPSTHPSPSAHLVFQSSSDLDLFLRAALCFSSSRFFSSLAWSRISVAVKKWLLYKQRPPGTAPGTLTPRRQVLAQPPFIRTQAPQSRHVKTEQAQAAERWCWRPGPLTSFHSLCVYPRSLLILKASEVMLKCFPDGPEALHLQCRGPRFNPWSGN